VVVGFTSSLHERKQKHTNMKRYRVRNWYKYSADVLVYAESENEARLLAEKSPDEDVNMDDYLDSNEVIEVDEQ